MNICIVAPNYPFKESMEYVFVKKLVDEWARKGHHCVVVCEYSLSSYYRKRVPFRPRYYKEDVGDDQIVEVYHPRFLSSRIRIGKISLDDWIAEKVVTIQIRKLNLRFDFIYSHFFAPSFKVYRYARKNNIPLFVATGESGLASLFNKGLPFPSFKREEYKEFISGVISVSSKNMNEAIEQGLIEKSKCQIFPNGTDQTCFKRLSKNVCREELNIPEDLFVVSCVGTICNRKGQDRILEAIRGIKRRTIKILFLGQESKAEQVNIEGDEVLFKGTVNNKDLPKYLCASDIFCLPTLAEGCCNAIIEAMSCGLPIVSSDLPFNYDVLDNQNSILVNPLDVEGIRNAILRLYEHPELRLEFSRVSLERSRSLSIEKRADSIMNFIKQRMKK